ncbi:unnamed protein product [Calicophoron daubneyi]
MVRCSALYLLARMSVTWPQHELSDPPPCLNSDVRTNRPQMKRANDTVSQNVHLVDDAFSRVCLRLQDPSRRVRHLAAGLLSDLSEFVSSENLVQTLEKFVMTDRQVRRSLLGRSSAVTTFGSQKSRTADTTNSRYSDSASTAGLLNLLSSGASGAIICGLEDDFFEVRCATLATVTHAASLSAQFALNCQDLLVDMLTDDIQDVRFAAIRALGAVGDQVPLQSEQVAIITSALAEGSGRIRRRLHHLLSRCRLASAPCLVSLLDGLLRNLRRYPQDRDSLWRCAASVGRRHPVFVETCLSSLLRTHSWLSGPEPNWEDPAYLTVLLLVLNAEPGAPGMQAKFPRHLKTTKAYLRELVPALLPSVKVSPLDSMDSVIPSKRRRIDYAAAPQLGGLSPIESLGAFLMDVVRRVVKILIEMVQKVRLALKSEGEADHVAHLGAEIQQRLALLSRLIFSDLCDTTQRLDRLGQIDGLIQWVGQLATIGWCLVSITTGSVRCPGAVLGGLDQICQPSGLKLLTKALHTSLKVERLFVGKTDIEQRFTEKLSLLLLGLVRRPVENNAIDERLVGSLHLIVSLLVSLLSPKIARELDIVTSDSENPELPSFDYSVCLKLLDKLDVAECLDELFAAARRLAPVYVALIQPPTLKNSNLSVSTTDGLVTSKLSSRVPLAISNRLAEGTEEGWNAAAGQILHSSPVTSATGSIPEVRFTATIASASIRLRALIVGMDLDVAKKHVCILFRRPDLFASVDGDEQHQMDSSPSLRSAKRWNSNFYDWWPPASGWHLLDENMGSNQPDGHKGSTASASGECVELRTHIELSAGRWSDAGTIELGLGFCLSDTLIPAVEYDKRSFPSAQYAGERSFILPLTTLRDFAKVKLIPCAPPSSW